MQNISRWEKLWVIIGGIFMQKKREMNIFWLQDKDVVIDI